MTALDKLPPLTELIHRHDLLARKSLGQHFLFDERITDTIARYAGDLSNVSVIEIGPGPGGLTRALLKAGARKVIAVEKDERCLAILEDLSRHAEGRLEIIHGDALEADIETLAPAPRRIVANLPYNAGTMMLLNWLEAVHREPNVLESMTLMFQKEVADRIVAEPGCKDFGRLTVLCQWLCDTRRDMELPPEAFTPPPKVSSTVVTLTPRAKPLVDVSKDALEKVMARAFGQRRKMLRQSLKGLAVPSEELLEKAGVDGTQRAEALDVVTLCNLAKMYQEIVSSLRA